MTERGSTHAQVNRDLREQFATLLSAADWDVALLQECPPRWAEHLATASAADAHLVLTARNLPFPLDRAQSALATLNPDLLASWEGGSNLTLARPVSGAPNPAIVERRSIRLAGRPERRVMAFTRLSSGIAVANLHASTNRAAAEREVKGAARIARRWAGHTPLVLGGDFNIRPRTSAGTFSALGEEYGFSDPTDGPQSDAIDHLLAAGLEVIEPTVEWPAGLREVHDPTTPIESGPLPIRLSDHTPITARFRIGRRVGDETRAAGA